MLTFLLGKTSNIRTNKLQDTVTKTMINNDDIMKAVFDKETMKQTEIMGGISKHLEKVKVVE
jgi:hypothetical protein